MVKQVNNGQPIVEAVGLTKVFKDFWLRTKARAVDRVDFEIHRHEIFGLLGPNGSGKSTIIKMILGLLHKTSGRLAVFGKPPSDVMVKKHIGFLPEESYLYRYLNPRETLEYYGKLFGLDRRTRHRRTDELLDMIGLTQVAHRPIGEFSKGMTRRIGIAQALINDPEFLILDEPTSGLDPIGTRQVKDLIIDLGRRGKTILLSSHLLADVEDVCHRMVVLYGGKIRAEGTVDELLCDTERTVLEMPRLKVETISMIERIIHEQEGKAIDRVEAPRQRLEELFLEIVDRARKEQVTTSGALAGGRTAAFLRGEGADGESLIDALVRDEPEQDVRAVPVERDRAVAKEPEGPSEDVLSELLSDAGPKGESTHPSREKGDVSDGAAKPADVDESVIESLLGSESPDEDQKRKS